MSEYPSASLPECSRQDRPAWLEPSTALGERGGLADDTQGWRRYPGALTLVAVRIAQGPRPARGEMSRGWSLGSAGLRLAMRERMARKGMDLEAERMLGLKVDELRREREALWDTRLGILAAKGKIRLETLPPQKSDPSKTLLAAAMKQSTSVSNGWLAKRLGMGAPASASQFVRRRLLTPAGESEFRRPLSNAKP